MKETLTVFKYLTKTNSLNLVEAKDYYGKINMEDVPVQADQLM